MADLDPDAYARFMILKNASMEDQDRARKHLTNKHLNRFLYTIPTPTQIKDDHLPNDARLDMCTRLVLDRKDNMGILNRLMNGMEMELNDKGEIVCDGIVSKGLKLLHQPTVSYVAQGNSCNGGGMHKVTLACQITQVLATTDNASSVYGSGFSPPTKNIREQFPYRKIVDVAGIFQKHLNTCLTWNSEDTISMHMDDMFKGLQAVHAAHATKQILYNGATLEDLGLQSDIDSNDEQDDEGGDTFLKNRMQIEQKQHKTLQEQKEQEQRLQRERDEYIERDDPLFDTYDVFSVPRSPPASTRASAPRIMWLPGLRPNWTTT